jgi:uncharacterized protein RhaS with RHS repeats
MAVPLDKVQRSRDAAVGALYLHADHLGSVDAVTSEGGSVEERRSYDAFGQRRNPVWGDPPPAVFESKTSLGFTGHESDAELGLVNMRGRIFDPTHANRAKRAWRDVISS